MATNAIPPISPSHRKTTTNDHLHHKQQPPTSSSNPSTTTNNHHHHHRHHKQQPPPSSSSNPSTTSTTSSSSLSSRNSLSTLRTSLPDNPHLYDISEIRTATNNFLSKNFSSSSWRCNLHGKDVVIFQRKSHHNHQNHHNRQNHQQLQIVRQKLSSICKSHHAAIVNLLGASVSGDYIYLVYEFINGGSNLSVLLHNQHNPDFTILNSWISRVQIATDLAHGLDYIHNNTGLLDVTFVHNHIKSSSVIVTEPSLNAKICHFGTAELCSEPIEKRDRLCSNSSSKIEEDNEEIVDEEIVDEDDEKKVKLLFNRSNSIKFNGTRGYMSPELQATGIGTRKSDVYAFGIVLLELLSGEEPMRYKFNKTNKEYTRISIVETARAMVEDDEDGREGRLRRWVDRRLKDSFPLEVAEKMTRLAVDCIHVDPDKRPDMRRVAGKISRLYLESRTWCERMKVPLDFTVSFAPR